MGTVCGKEAAQGMRGHREAVREKEPHVALSRFRLLRVDGGPGLTWEIFKYGFLGLPSGECFRLFMLGYRNLQYVYVFNFTF